MHKIELMDVTIRDGSYAIDYSYSPDLVANIVCDLEKASVDYAEISHGLGLGAKRLGFPAHSTDEEYVKATREKINGKIKIGAIAGPNSEIKDIEPVANYIDFIRFAENVGSVEKAKDKIDFVKAKYPKIDVFIQIMRCSRLPEEDVLKSARIAEDLGVKIIYLVDTVGSYLPSEVSRLISLIKSKCKKSKIGFHGHDNLRLAVANSIAAIEAGANVIDGSLKGMGRSAGNASTEILAHILKKNNWNTKLDPIALTKSSEINIVPIMPPQKGVASIDLLTVFSNIDLYPLELFKRIANYSHMPMLEFIDKLSKQPIVEPDLNNIKLLLDENDLDGKSIIDKVLSEIK